MGGRRRLLADSKAVPAAWSLALAYYGYETVGELLSTCTVDGGVAAIAHVVGCTAGEVRKVEAALREDLGSELIETTPVDRPLGAVLQNSDGEEAFDE